jgi:hypothetical protein
MTTPYGQPPINDTVFSRFSPNFQRDELKRWHAKPATPANIERKFVPADTDSLHASSS